MFQIHLVGSGNGKTSFFFLRVIKVVITSSPYSKNYLWKWYLWLEKALKSNVVNQPVV